MGDSNPAPAPEQKHNRLRIDCWTRAREAFGTAYIFERRANRLGRSLRMVSFAGFVVPLITGGFALSYGASFVALPIIIIVGSAVGIAQVAVSGWSLVSSWVESYSYATESVVSNMALFLRFKELASNPPNDYETFLLEYRSLQAQDDARREQDYKRQVSDREKRMVMRAGLREMGKECSACKTVPTSMKPSNCEVCGDY